MRATRDRRQPPTAEGVRASITATPLALFPLQGSPGESQAGELGSRHTPTLCAFPEAHPSVILAAFVLRTVAGQHWSCTSFPAHRTLV